MSKVITIDESLQPVKFAVPGEPNEHGYTPMEKCSYEEWLTTPVNDRHRDDEVGKFLHKYSPKNSTAVRGFEYSGYDIHHQNYFEYLAFCYAKHISPVLSADIINHLIICEFAARIAEHPEKYRAYFSESSSKEKITVPTDDPLSFKHQNFINELQNRVSAEVASLMKTSFNEDMHGSKLARNLAWMDAASPFYSYSMFMCGFPHIAIVGDDDDWKSLITFCLEISSIAAGAGDFEYKSHMETSAELCRSIKTGIDNEDIEFLKKMFYTEVCGSGSQEEVFGWIFNFCFEVPSIKFVHNYTSCRSVVDYTIEGDDTEYSIVSGLFVSRLSIDGFAIPMFENFIVKKDK